MWQGDGELIDFPPDSTRLTDFPRFSAPLNRSNLGKSWEKAIFDDNLIDDRFSQHTAILIVNTSPFYVPPRRQQSHGPKHKPSGSQWARSYNCQCIGQQWTVHRHSFHGFVHRFETIQPCSSPVHRWWNPRITARCSTIRATIRATIHTCNSTVQHHGTLGL